MPNDKFGSSRISALSVLARFNQNHQRARDYCRQVTHDHPHLYEEYYWIAVEINKHEHEVNRKKSEAAHA